MAGRNNMLAWCCCVFIILHWQTLAESPFSMEDRLRLKNTVKQMFYHGYDNYIAHAFPYDDLKPISCTGFDNLGNYSATLIDTLDTLVIMGNYSEFEKQMWWVVDNINFDKDVNVSVFETNIRILGGLLSSHLLITKTNLPLISNSHGRKYNSELLHLAEDLGRRLLPAFATETGIPFGTVNLRHGVPINETPVTCTAGGGTFAIEFGILSKLTNNPIFEQVARGAMRGLWSKRSSNNLIGNHINTKTGEWVHRGAGIGAGADSFYEYLLKAAILFNDLEYLKIWHDAYEALVKWTKVGNWYVEVDYAQLAVTYPAFGSLQCYWPGVQALYGDVGDAILTLLEFYGIWRRFGFTPEALDLSKGAFYADFGRGYPLRPELAESLFFLSYVVPDPFWYTFGRDMVENLNNYTSLPCGHAAINDVLDHSLRDHMDSFFLSETCKYLYLLFDDTFITSGNWVFNTEAHVFPVTKEFTSMNPRRELEQMVGPILDMQLGRRVCSVLPKNYYSLIDWVYKKPQVVTPKETVQVVHKSKASKELGMGAKALLELVKKELVKQGGILSVDQLAHNVASLSIDEEVEVLEVVEEKVVEEGIEELHEGREEEEEDGKKKKKGLDGKEVEQMGIQKDGEEYTEVIYIDLGEISVVTVGEQEGNEVLNVGIDVDFTLDKSIGESSTPSSDQERIIQKKDHPASDWLLADQVKRLEKENQRLRSAFHELLTENGHLKETLLLKTKSIEEMAKVYQREQDKLLSTLFKLNAVHKKVKDQLDKFREELVVLRKRSK